MPDDNKIKKRGRPRKDDDLWEPVRQKFKDGFGNIVLDGNDDVGGGNNLVRLLKGIAISLVWSLAVIWVVEASNPIIKFVSGVIAVLFFYFLWRGISFFGCIFNDVYQLIFAKRDKKTGYRIGDFNPMFFLLSLITYAVMTYLFLKFFVSYFGFQW